MACRSSSNGDDGHATTLSILEGTHYPLPSNCNLMSYFGSELETGRIQPSTTALLWNNQSFSFSWLHQTSSNIAQVLQQKILSDNKDSKLGDQASFSLIGVCATPSEKVIAILFGILKCDNVAYVPIDPNYPKERVKFIIKDCDLKYIIIDDNNDQMIKNLESNVQVIRIDELFGEALSLKRPPTKIDGQKAKEQSGDIAAVLYTSGSSGTPKGVKLCHRNILNRLTWQWSAFPYIIDFDVCLWKTSLTFVDSVPEIFGPLLAGVSLAIINQIEAKCPHALIRNIYEYQVTRLILVPSLLETILSLVKHLEVTMNNNNDRNNNDYGDIGVLNADYKNKCKNVVGGRKLLASLNLWICSGEILSKKLALEFFDIFKYNSRLANFYGSTEVLGDASYVLFHNKSSVENKMCGRHNTLPIGENMVNNNMIYVVNPNDLEVCPIGDTGEIWIAGANVADGYINSHNESKFIQNPFTTDPSSSNCFRTGDFGFISTSTSTAHTGEKQNLLLYYEGRKDSQLKIRGQKINLLEIENIIHHQCSHDVNKVIVLCHTSEKTEKQTLVAFVIPKIQDICKSALVSEITSKLRGCEMPDVQILSNFPYLVNGKIDRIKLLDDYEKNKHQHQQSDCNIVIPNNKNKLDHLKILVSIISEITGTSYLDLINNLTSSFYLVGGNSLNSIAVVVKLWESGFHIEINDFINADSIKNIVQFMKPREESNNKLYSSSKLYHQQQEQQLIVETQNKFNKLQECHFEPIKEEHKFQLIHILAKGFAEKGDLEAYTGATYADYENLIESIWEASILNNELCFVCIRSSDNQILGVSLNFDYVDFCTMTPVQSSIAISYVFEIIQFIQDGLRFELPMFKGQLIRSSLGGTWNGLDYASNVYIMELMSQHLTVLALQANYAGILSVNTSCLTQSIDRDVQGYSTLIEYQINKFVAQDGSAPFASAPNSQTVVSCIKYLKNE